MFDMREIVMWILIAAILLTEGFEQNISRGRGGFEAGIPL